MKLVLMVMACATAGLVASAATADPRLDEKVYAPYVQNGVAEFEVRTAGQDGGAQGGDMTTVLEGEYGLSDRVSLAVVGAVQRSPTEGTRLTSIGLEAVAYVGQIPGIDIDTGVYLEYGHGLNGEADVLEGKLLFAKTLGRFQGLVNFIVERPLGPEHERFASYGYAASATWQVRGPLRLGAEAFGDLGDDHDFPGPQGAYVGPQVLWEGHLGHSPIELGIDAGWLFPVGAFAAETRSQPRLGIELERRF